MDNTNTGMEVVMQHVMLPFKKHLDPTMSATILAQVIVFFISMVHALQIIVLFHFNIETNGERISVITHAQDLKSSIIMDLVLKDVITLLLKPLEME